MLLAMALSGLPRASSAMISISRGVKFPFGLSLPPGAPATAHFLEDNQYRK